MTPLRNRYLAACFIVVMYLLVGALLVGLLATALSPSGMWSEAAVLMGGALGAGFGVWRLRRTSEDERADDHIY
ncbi:hypothetical protein [Streptomyces massasporeus]|uniref:hypothetical protein n=1 Tax=Streptomyces massasporeus TaxID=67324 RepID=UPI00167B4C52|nr:hypothetical protein [Streptomyces massasporeus]